MSGASELLEAYQNLKNTDFFKPENAKQYNETPLFALEARVGDIEESIQPLENAKADYIEALRSVDGNRYSSQKHFQKAEQALEVYMGLMEDKALVLSQISSLAPEHDLLTQERLDGINDFISYRESYDNGTLEHRFDGSEEGIEAIKAELLADNFQPDQSSGYENLSESGLEAELHHHLERAIEWKVGRDAIRQKVEQWPEATELDFARFNDDFRAMHRGQLALEKSIGIYQAALKSKPDHNWVNHQQLMTMKAYMDSRNKEYGNYIKQERQQCRRFKIELPNDETLKGVFSNRYNLGGNKTLAQFRADTQQTHENELDDSQTDNSGTSNRERLEAFFKSEGYLITKMDVFDAPRAQSLGAG